MLASSRDSIDANNLTALAVTDAGPDLVSVGAEDPYQTGTGTLVATAVLVKTPVLPAGVSSNAGYAPTRVDVLLFVRAIIPLRSSIADFYVTLYSDDGTATHNPSQQMAPPYSLAGQATPLQIGRGVWYQQDITQASWPVLTPNTYYWVVLTPGTPLSLFGAGTVNGAIWGGLDDSINPLPVQALNDPHIFKGRQLVSITGPTDTAFGSMQPASVSFLQSALNWPSVPSASSRFTNWASAGSRVRYGVQIIGVLQTLSASATVSLSASRTGSATPSGSRTPSPTATPFPTTIAGTRYTIDRFNLTYQKATDNGNVSIGAINAFGDGKGSLVGTAVLIRTSRNLPTDPVDWIYRPNRIDVLLAARATLSDQVPINSFFVTLFADDNSTSHSPAGQLAPPFRITLGGGFTVPRGSWFQQDITSAGWPNLDANSYYWVALTPAVTLTFANGVYNGAVWVGIDDTISPNLPPTYAGDTAVFKARQLTSERSYNDASFAANAASAVTWMNSQQVWSAVDRADVRFTDFAQRGSNVRYGIQLLGWQISPSPSFTASGALLVASLGCVRLALRGHSPRLSMLLPSLFHVDGVDDSKWDVNFIGYCHGRTVGYIDAPCDCKHDEYTLCYADADGDALPLADRHFDGYSLCLGHLVFLCIHLGDQLGVELDVGEPDGLVVGDERGDEDCVPNANLVLHAHTLPLTVGDADAD